MNEQVSVEKRKWRGEVTVHVTENDKMEAEEGSVCINCPW